MFLHVSSFKHALVLSSSLVKACFSRISSCCHLLWNITTLSSSSCANLFLRVRGPTFAGQESVSALQTLENSKAVCCLPQTEELERSRLYHEICWPAWKQRKTNKFREHLCVEQWLLYARSITHSIKLCRHLKHFAGGKLNINHGFHSTGLIWGI